MCAWDQYEVLGALGKGKYGVVSRARHRKLGNYVALKSVIDLQIESDESSSESLNSEARSVSPTNLSKHRATLYHEAKILAKLDHPALVSLVELCVNQEGELVIAMEDLGGMSLTGLVQRNDNTGLCWSLVGCIVGHIGNALAYMHTKGFIHRDIKPDNIMIENNGSCYPNAKLIDFGLSISFSEDNLPNSSITRAGTLSNIAPELMNPHVLYGPKVDLFSLGTAIYFALIGDEPFTTYTSKGGQRCTTAMFGLQASHEEGLDELTPEIKSVVKTLLELDAEKRISVGDLLDSTWVVKSFNGGKFFQSDFNLLDSWLSLHQNESTPRIKCLRCSFSSSQSSLTSPSEDFSLGSDISESSEGSYDSSLQSSDEKVSTESDDTSSQASLLKGFCKTLGFSQGSCNNENTCVCNNDILLDGHIVSNVAKVLDEDTELIHSNIVKRPWGKEGGVYNLLKMNNQNKFYSLVKTIKVKESSNVDNWKTQTM